MENKQKPNHVKNYLKIKKVVKQTLNKFETTINVFNKNKLNQQISLQHKKQIHE